MGQSLCEACGKRFDSKPSYRQHKKAMIGRQHTRIDWQNQLTPGIGLQTAKQPLSSSNPQESQGENCQQKEEDKNEADGREGTNSLDPLLDSCNVPEQTRRSGSEPHEDWELVIKIQGDKVDDHAFRKRFEAFMDDMGWGDVVKIVRGRNRS